MKCADIMSKQVEWLSATDSVQKAALLMKEAGVGFLPICDERQRVLGVVTDRDLATRALTERVSPSTTSAALFMTSPAVTCREDAVVAVAEELMARERKSRLVITDDDGKLAGVLSLADLVRHVSGRESLKTISAVLWREALGPRGGAPRDQPLLKDDPVLKTLPPPSDDADEKSPSVFVGGHRITDTKEFPG